MLLCVLLIIPVIFFSGCGESQQINQKLIVQGICVDNAEAGCAVTVQALDFQNPMSKDEPDIKIIEVTGISLVEALENILKQTNLTPVYSQNLIVILGESVAKEGVSDFMDFFVRHFETRPKVKICVTKGKACELFKLKLKGKPVKAQNIHDLIPDELNSDILHFISNLKNKISDPCTAWLDIGTQANGNNACMRGAGIFSGDVLKEFLGGDEAFGFMLLKGVPKFGSCVIKTEETGEVTCTVDKISSKTSVSINSGVPVFNIVLEPEISVFSMDRKFDASFSESTRLLIRDKFSEKMSVVCEAVINKLMNLGSDPLNFGRILKNSYPEYFKNLNQEWSKYMKSCEYVIDKKTEVNIIGKEPL
jgi:spore germination protein KC